MEAEPTTEAIPATSPGLDERVAKAVNEEGYAIVTDVLDRVVCDELVLEVWTDGRITPDDALKQSAAILRHHLEKLQNKEVKEIQLCFHY